MVSALRINEFYNFRKDNRLLAIEAIDWPQTILEMFSRKLNKLQIVADCSPGYLSLPNADKLKKVIFFVQLLCLISKFHHHDQLWR